MDQTTTRYLLRIGLFSTLLFGLSFSVFAEPLAKSTPLIVAPTVTTTTTGPHKINRITQSMHPSGYPVYPKIDLTKGEANRIQRGEYLAKVGDCIACHTSSSSSAPAFAGGLAFHTPFGTLYSTNITPDPNTGIGTWSESDFIRAVREGISPSGKNYYPVMPYPYFNKLSQSDAKALYAYFMAIPPVWQQNKTNDMHWPFNWRFLQLGWKALFFYWHRGEFHPSQRHNPHWNRGAYLVEGLGHCSMCHTPMNIFGAPERQYYLHGAMVNGYFASDITGDVMSQQRTAAIANVLQTGEMLSSGGQVQGPMSDVVHDSLSFLTTDDLNDIADFLKTVRSKAPPTPTVSGDNDQAAITIFEKTCAVCHSTGAAGAPKLDDAAAWQPRIQQGLSTLYQHALQGFNSMPPRGTCTSCTDSQIEAVVRYMVKQAENSPVKAANPTFSLPPLSEGQTVYQKYCASCHSNSTQSAPLLGDQAAWAPRIEKGIDVLFNHAIRGYQGSPPMGGCPSCSQALIQTAVIYLVEHSKTTGEYRLWYTAQ